MELFREKILNADMIVFVTPLYYDGMSAQLKILVNRFCAINSSINRKHMESAFLAVAWNADDWTSAKIKKVSGDLIYLLTKASTYELSELKKTMLSCII